MKLNVFACTGRMTAEVLSPQGKLPVHVNQTAQRAEVSFKAVCEGEALRHALTHAFTRVANQSLTDSPFCHSLYSRLHLCCHSLTDSPCCHSLTDSSLHPCCHSLTDSRLHRVGTHSRIHAFTRSITHPLTQLHRWFNCHLLIDSRLHPLLSFPHLLTPSPVLLLTH